MVKIRAAVGSAAFLCLAPGMVAGLIPWWITGWRSSGPYPFDDVLRPLGGALLLGGIGVLLQAFVRFVVEGLGTPAPVAPTEHLVVGGAYRHVRNPMYVAIVTVIIAQALLFGSWPLAVYGVLIGLVQAAFVRLHEEPALLHRYGQEYEAYRRAVPGWWPQLRGWRPDQAAPR